MNVNKGYLVEKYSFLRMHDTYLLIEKRYFPLKIYS